MDTAAFDYELPPDRIAQTPVEPRDAARLLVDDAFGPPRHRHVSDLPELLRAGDLLVVNETRVLPARLHLRKATGGAVEVLLLDAPSDSGDWVALVRPGRRVPPGTVLTPDAPRPGFEHVRIEVGTDLGDGRRAVRVTSPPGRTELESITAIGSVPLPPYITSPLADVERYQTVYARRPASAAAPTAGLHLTAELLARIEDRGVRRATVELVVGSDTFRPITTAAVEDHVMHTEAYGVPQATWDLVQATRAGGGRVVAVGTTSVRALESAAALGRLEGRTELFITPGHRFAAVDVLLTNFHLPRSSLLVLVEAFAGPRWRALYADALASGYRFLSFGDAMLLAAGPTATMAR